MDIMAKQDKVVSIIGPTATGKSDLAVELALRFNGEVISADSRQIYRGMDIGTGKITPEEMRSVPHHLLDVTNPGKQFSADDYKSLAIPVIAGILSHGRLPVICGGTGLYIRALLSGIELPAVAPNYELREELSSWNTEDLVGELENLDPERTKDIDKQNRHRLIRAIEIARAIGHVTPLSESSPYNVLYIGLTLPTAELHERIHSRLFSRLENGMIEEVEKLHKSGVSHERLRSFGLEYRYVSLYLTKELTKEQMVTKLEFEIRHYAKRQMTWFKKYTPAAKWFTPNDRENIFAAAKKFLV